MGLKELIDINKKSMQDMETLCGKYRQMLAETMKTTALLAAQNEELVHKYECLSQAVVNYLKLPNRDERLVIMLQEHGY